LQQFFRKDAALTLLPDEEKPNVPRKTEAVANNNLPAEKPGRVVRVQNNQPMEPSPGEPANPPAVTVAPVWYWYQNNLPVTNWWPDTPLLNGFTPLFFGSLRMPPLPPHPQSPSNNLATPLGGTGTTIQEQNTRVFPAFRRPPFVPDPFNRGGANARGNQPRIPGGLSVPANITPTFDAGPGIIAGTPQNPTPQNQTGTGNSTTTGGSTTTPANTTTMNRGGSIRQVANSPAATGGNAVPGGNIVPNQTVTGGNTVRNQTVRQLPPGWDQIVPGPGDDWKRFPSQRPPGFPGGTGGVTNPGTGGVTNPGTGNPPSVPGPGDDWKRFNRQPGFVPNPQILQRPPWWRIAPMTPMPNRPAAPATPKR